MSTAAAILLGVYLILLALVHLGVSIPGLVLAVIALLAGVLIIATGLPWGVKQ